MRAQDIFGLFGRPRRTLGVLPSWEELAQQRASRICDAAESLVGTARGSSEANSAHDAMHRALTDPVPGSQSLSTINARAMGEWIDAAAKKCPDLENLIYSMVKEDFDQQRKKEDEAKKADLFNTSAAFVAPGTATPGGSANPNKAFEDASQKARDQAEAQNTPSTPGYNPYNTVSAPSSTGGAHDYEEQVAEYNAKMKEFQEASQKARDEADAQIKASNAARDAAEQALKDKYESGNPNAVCGPGEFWDGKQCRGSVQGGAGGLMNQAMNFGPSGGTQMVTPGNLDLNPSNLNIGRTSMGRRFPVVNLK